LTGSAYITGSSSNSVLLAASTTTSDVSSAAYRGAIKKLEVGSAVTLAQNALRNCYSLEAVENASVSGYALYGCSSLKSVGFSGKTSAIGTEAFRMCYALRTVKIPEKVTTVNASAFYYCYSLERVEMPSTVTAVQKQAFFNCYALTCIDFSKCTAVPSLEATTAFSGVPSDFEIRVPSALYDEWIAATNWSTYADNIIVGV
jgi:hypothetical protein